MTYVTSESVTPECPYLFTCMSIYLKDIIARPHNVMKVDIYM